MKPRATKKVPLSVLNKDDPPAEILRVQEAGLPGTEPQESHPQSALLMQNIKHYPISWVRKTGLSNLGSKG